MYNPQCIKLHTAFDKNVSLRHVNFASLSQVSSETLSSLLLILALQVLLMSSDLCWLQFVLIYHITQTLIKYCCMIIAPYLPNHSSNACVNVDLQYICIFIQTTIHFVQCLFSLPEILLNKTLKVFSDAKHLCYPYYKMLQEVYSG